MNTAAIYETFEGFEMQAADLYVVISRRFAEHARLSWFWAEMALEELEHSSMLRLCREYGLVDDDGVNDALLGSIRDVLKRAAAAGARPGLTVTEAFRLALEIESCELERAYEKLTRPLYRPYPFLQEALHQGMRDHQRRFAKAIIEFSDDPTLAEHFETLARDHPWSRPAGRVGAH